MKKSKKPQLTFSSDEGEAENDLSEQDEDSENSPNKSQTIRNSQSKKQASYQKGKINRRGMQIMQSISSNGGILNKNKVDSQGSNNAQQTPLGFHGYFNVVMKNAQSKSFSVVEETMKIFRDYQTNKALQIITIIYLEPPQNKKLLSEEIISKRLPADAANIQRTKLFDQGDIIVTGRFLPSEQLPSHQSNQDVLVFEIITTKLTLTQASKQLLPPLISLSSKLVIDLGDDDLLAGLDSSIKLLHPLISAFNYNSLKAYPEEDSLDVVSQEIAPLSVKFKSGDSRISGANSANTDIIEQALNKIQQTESVSQIRVMYRNRELIVEGNSDPIKNLINPDNQKKFFPKRAQITVNIVLKFLDLYIKKPKDTVIDYRSNLAGLFIEQQNQINEDAMNYFDDEISQYQSNDKPQSEEDLTMQLLDLKNATLSKMDKAKKYIVDNSQQKKQEDLRKKFDTKTFPTLMTDIIESNLILSQQILKKQVDKSFQKMLKALKTTQNKSQTNNFAYSLQTLEHEFSTTFLSTIQENSVQPGSSAVILEFLERNLIEKLYKPLIEEEIERQMILQQNEDQDVMKVQDQVSQLEKELKMKQAQIESKRQFLEDLQTQHKSQMADSADLDRRIQDHEHQLEERRIQLREHIENQKLQQEAKSNKSIGSSNKSRKGNTNAGSKDADITDDKDEKNTKNCACQCIII